MRVCYFILFTISVIFLAGCGSATPINQSTAQNTVNAPSQTKPETIPAAPAVSPTDTLKALSAASKAGNVPEIKRRLSQGTLALFEEGAKEQKRPMDELLKEKDNAPFLELPDLGSERIIGETATVEIKNTETGLFEPFPFVKENGEWKVAIDVYLNELDLQLDDDLDKP